MMIRQALFIASVCCMLGVGLGIRQNLEKGLGSELRSNDGGDSPPRTTVPTDSKSLTSTVGVKVQGFTCNTFDVHSQNALKASLRNLLALGKDTASIEVAAPDCGGAPAAGNRRRLLAGSSRASLIVIDVSVRVGVPEKFVAVRRSLLLLAQTPERFLESFKAALQEFGVVVPVDLSVTLFLKSDETRDKLVAVAQKLSKSLCNYQDCRQCTKDPNCGWCDVKGICQPGDALGPAQGTVGEPCSLWSYESCGGSACSGFSSCDDCRGDPDCGWCEDTCTCQDKHPSDPTTPEFGECKRGWFHSQGWARKMCPAPAVSSCALKRARDGKQAPAWVPSIPPKGSPSGAYGQRVPGAPIPETSAKPNGGLDVNLYPASLVVQSSITIVGYTVATFKNMDKIAFRTGIAAEMGASMAAVEIDGVYNGKVPSDDQDDAAAPSSALRRRLLETADDVSAIAITFSIGSETKDERDRLKASLDAAIRNSGALLQSLQMSGLTKATAVVLDDAAEDDSASGPAAAEIYGFQDPPKPKKKEQPKLWDSDGSGASGPSAADSGATAVGAGSGASGPEGGKTKKKCPFSKVNINSPCFMGNTKVTQKSKCIGSGANPTCMAKAKAYCSLKFCGCRDPACKKFGLAKPSKCAVPKCPFSKKNPKSPCYEGDCGLPKIDKNKKAHRCRLVGATRECLLLTKKYCKTKDGCVDDACIKFKLASKKCDKEWAVGAAFQPTDQDAAPVSKM